MKNYSVQINTETRPFQEKQMQRIGSCQAKNKKEAIEKVYAAFWGKDNDAIIYSELTGIVGPSSKSRMIAIVE